MRLAEQSSSRCLRWLPGALLVGATSLGVTAVTAQDAQRTLVDVSACVELPDAAARLACFDARAASSRAPVREEAKAAAAREPTREEAEERADSRPPTAPQQSARVTALATTVPNSWLITLDNDQVWSQVQPRRYPLRVGMEVQIYPPPWGDTLRLKAAELNGYIQVTRVR